MNLGPFLYKIRPIALDFVFDASKLIRFIADRIEDRPSWEALFEQMPVALTNEEKTSWIGQLNGVALASDAFFPFRDNIVRAHQVLHFLFTC